MDYRKYRARLNTALFFALLSLGLLLMIIGLAVGASADATLQDATLVRVERLPGGEQVLIWRTNSGRFHTEQVRGGYHPVGTRKQVYLY